MCKHVFISLYLFYKKKVAIELTATLNKHEDIKRESIKKLVLFLNPFHIYLI